MSEILLSVLVKQEGPPLEPLLRRVLETPAEFTAPPRYNDSGETVVAAVVGDLQRNYGLIPASSVLERFDASTRATTRNHHAVALLIAWLLTDNSLQSHPLTVHIATTLFCETVDELAEQVSAQKLVVDPHRREELVRLVLARWDLRPQGESVAQAQDRLTSLSSAERKRVLQAAQAAERRAREIRAALARKAAEESADKWTRE